LKTKLHLLHVKRKLIVAGDEIKTLKPWSQMLHSAQQIYCKQMWNVALGS